jgi:tetratricopeptide (TPR) repeat protein
LLSQRRFGELESRCRAALKGFRELAAPDDGAVVKWTLTLAAALLSRAQDAPNQNDETRSAALRNEATTLLRELAVRPLDAVRRRSASWESGAEALARAGHWAEAAKIFARLVEADVKDASTYPHLQSRYGVLLLAAGDLAGYEHARQRALTIGVQKHGLSAVEAVTELALLRPMNGATPEVTAMLMEGATNVASRGLGGDELCLGFIQFRQGRHAEAVETLKEASDKRYALAWYPPNGAKALAVVAMARHHLGQSSEARAALDECAAVLKAKWFGPTRGALQGWPSWLAVHLLHAEAAALLGGRPGQAQAP